MLTPDLFWYQDFADTRTLLAPELGRSCCSTGSGFILMMMI
jgi:hypothetical protein